MLKLSLSQSALRACRRAICVRVSRRTVPQQPHDHSNMSQHLICSSSKVAYRFLRRQLGHLHGFPSDPPSGAHHLNLYSWRRLRCWYVAHQENEIRALVDRAKQ